MNPILLEIPVPILTPRLLLRPLEQNDAEQLNVATSESMDELKVYMPWAQAKPSLTESLESILKSRAQWILREDLRLGFFDRVTGQLIGCTGMHQMNWDVPSVEIGYWVRSSCAKKGFTTEAANAVAHFAFKQLKARRVEIKCNSRNEPSKRVAEKLGFELEGCLRNSHINMQTKMPEDTLVYSLLSADRLPALDVQW